MESAEIKRLKRKVAELRLANEILRTASAFFAAEPGPRDEMIQYVDLFRDRFGVEDICRTLGATKGGFITARGYWTAKTRPLSARAVSQPGQQQSLRRTISAMEGDPAARFGGEKRSHDADGSLGGNAVENAGPE